MQEMCVEVANSLNLKVVKRQERVIYIYELQDIDISDSLVIGEDNAIFLGHEPFLCVGESNRGEHYSQVAGRENGRNDR
jgi:hypothetical protein